MGSEHTCTLLKQPLGAGGGILGTSYLFFSTLSLLRWETTISSTLIEKKSESVRILNLGYKQT